MGRRAFQAAEIAGAKARAGEVGKWEKAIVAGMQ